MAFLRRVFDSAAAASSSRAVSCMTSVGEVGFERTAQMVISGARMHDTALGANEGAECQWGKIVGTPREVVVYVLDMVSVMSWFDRPCEWDNTFLPVHQTDVNPLHGHVAEYITCREPEEPDGPGMGRREASKSRAKGNRTSDLQKSSEICRWYGYGLKSTIV